MSNLSKLLNRSSSLAQQGDLAGARTELEKAIQEHGNRSEPWISLAAIHGMGGNFTEATRCARKAVELAPNSLQGWINLASAAQATADFPLAAEALTQAHRLPGRPPRVTLDLGMVLAKLDRLTEAEKILREHLTRNPGNSETTLMLARVLAKNGKADAAASLLDEQRRLHPQDNKDLVELGRVYCVSGRSQDAWNCLEQALKINASDPDTLFFKVELLDFEGRLNEAVDTLDQLGRLLPENDRVFSYFSAISHGLGHPNDAIAYAHAALKLNPNHLPWLIQLSSILLTQDINEARLLFNQAEALAPHDPMVKSLKGQLLEFEGDKQGAWECVSSVVKGEVLDGSAAVIAARVAPALGKSDETITLLEQLVDRPGISNHTHKSLRFALAQLCDKAKQYDRAFEHAIIANQLKNVSHDQNAKQAKINRLKAVYSEAGTANLPRSQNNSELPIFIVGMPRSGTSLLEQILSCHSQVHARGETTDIRTLTESIPYYPDGMRNLSQDKCDALTNTYIQRLKTLAPATSRVTDKMPGNYMHVGLIGQLFPGAKIINCRRDPRDICLSNFMLDFLHSTAYAYNLESLALTCKDYQELITHWKHTQTLPILDVRYEDLIADPQTWVAKILDFCGLEWEDACLNFHKSDRQVSTASYDQVRKPLYKTSVARWKHYEQHLEPVSRILGLHGDSYP